jgi:hypothetical protein
MRDITIARPLPWRVLDQLDPLTAGFYHFLEVSTGFYKG